MVQGPLSVGLVNPAPNVVLTASPLSLLLEFDRPILPDTLNNDVVVVQTDASGKPPWFTVPGPLTMDQSAAQLSAPLTQALAPGHYQVWILGDSGILDLDGNYLTDGVTNLIVGQFDVAVTGISLNNAVELANPRSTPLEIPGFLDFQADPTAVSLYRIDLEPGHFWRLGLEVSAQRDGGSLDTALALFDDGGRLIASDDLGRSDAPKDSYLFAGLPPGIYYIGVSGVGNLPGLPGGYNPVTGSPGSVTQTQDGGPFTLHVVADPVDTPPTVLELTFHHADPADSAPTGLTLAFSRAIAMSSQVGGREQSLSNSIEVIDQAGQAWPVQVSNYSESDASISYLFDEGLPPGNYVVRLSEQGGLTDLAGLSPVADGEPSGVLGQFKVPPREDSHNPLDLGPLLPAAAAAGARIDVTLSQGQSITYRVVVTVPGLYIFQEQSSGDPPSVQITGPAVDQTLSPTGTNDTLLTPGVYSIRFDSSTGDAGDTELFFRLSSDQTEIVLANGVGQGPALSLRLISYSEGTVTQPPTITQQVFGPLPSAVPTPTPVGTNDASGGSSPHAVSTDQRTLQRVPFPVTSAVTISFLSMGSDLVGRPTVPAPAPQSSQLVVMPGAVPGTSNSLARGQSLQALPLSPGRFPWETARWTSSNPEDVVASRPVEASMIGIDLRPLIDRAIDFRQWVAQREQKFLSWSGSWFGERPMSQEPSSHVTRLISDLGPRPSGIASGSEEEIGTNDPDRAIVWTTLFSPPVVVISVAAIAQVCWHSLHWLRTRRGAERMSAAKTPVRPIAWDRLHTSLLIGSHSRGSS
jgi:hypothetical protein